jgi:hypothetical protein
MLLGSRFLDSVIASLRPNDTPEPEVRHGRVIVCACRAEGRLRRQ